MKERDLLELAADTIDKAETILKMTAEEYRKEYGSEAVKVEQQKLERVQVLIENLNFFIKKMFNREEGADVCEKG